jgi:hypothetical protein
MSASLLMSLILPSVLRATNNCKIQHTVIDFITYELALSVGLHTASSSRYYASEVHDENESLKIYLNARHELYILAFGFKIYSIRNSLYLLCFKSFILKMIPLSKYTFFQRHFTEFTFRM